ncbi:MAG: folylpolyglutamate synthase/dihydrofolate synthase family protein [Treponemataceae bacterium]|nr:MAG: folylpolyglutamate synthase/dihydrofolate synthase family protein [Treponemataceae bacterium]
MLNICRQAVAARELHTVTRFPALSGTEEWFDTFLNFERDPKQGIFWLKTVEFLCDLVGNPQNTFRSIHVAGSKGKGSVCAMLANIVDGALSPVGLYMSPHVADFAERFTLCGAFFDDSAYSAAFTELKTAVDAAAENSFAAFPESRKPTWFELVTVFAFLLFKNAHCKIAVFETGMGGRLDATNVLQPSLCIINTIELEHTEYLGDTLEKIAAEKGGIIKNGVPTLVAPQEKCVQTVLERIAAEKHARLYLLSDCAKVEAATGQNGTSVRIDSPYFARTLECVTGLSGGIQAQNAALAAVAAKLVLPDVSEACIENALAKTVLPARFELHRDNAAIPLYVLDGAHTPKSIAETVATFCSVCGYGGGSEGAEAALLFACAIDKEVEAIARAFARNFADSPKDAPSCPIHWTKIILTRPGQAKQCDPERMQNAFAQAGLEAAYIDDCTSAIQSAFDYAAHHHIPLLVTGSFYLASEVGSIMRICI